MWPTLQKKHVEMFGTEIVGGITVSICHGMDGISIEEPFKSSPGSQLPSKVIIGSLRVLDVSVETDDGNHLLWENPQPNSPFAPPTILCIADENCSLALSTICSKLNPFFNKMTDFFMKINGVLIDITLDQQMDGKLRQHIYGHGGPMTKESLQIKEKVLNYKYFL